MKIMVITLTLKKVETLQLKLLWVTLVVVKVLNHQFVLNQKHQL